MQTLNEQYKQTNRSMNKETYNDFSQISIRLFIVPLVILGIVIVWLGAKNAINDIGYVEIQREAFFAINGFLSRFRGLEYNLTQMGDAVIFLSILSCSFMKFPKMWEALIVSSILSGLVSQMFKRLLTVPRPAECFGEDSFSIIGSAIHGFHSTPSGHSITIFTTLTVLFFAFMPQKNKRKILWTVLFIVVGLFIASSRVGVGAHHPLDVVLGSIFGYISGLLGIFFIRRFPRAFGWIRNKKALPFFALVFIGFAISIALRVIKEPLIVYIFSLISLIFIIYEISKAYIRSIQR